MPTSPAAACLALAACLGCGKSDSTTGPTPSPTPTASVPTAAARAEPPPAMTASEEWSVDLPGATTARIRFVESWGPVSVVEIERAVTLGNKTLAPRGDIDVVVVSHAADGAISSVTQIGGDGDDDIQDVADAGPLLWIAVKSTGKLQAAGKTFTPPAPKPDALSLPTVSVALALRKPGEVVQAVALPVGESHVIAAGPDGGLFVAVGRIGDESYFGEVILSRLDRAGKPMWTRRWEAGQPAELTWEPASHSLAFSLRQDTALTVFRVSEATGETVSEASVVKPSGGDLGSISGLVFVGDTLLAGGETGGMVRAGGRDHQPPSHAIRPFVLSIGAGAPEFADIEDVTGHVVAAGAIGAVPATVVAVIHTGADKSLHRGTYVRLGGANGARLIPIYQYQYDNDDWEHAPRQDVMGTEIHPRSAAFHKSDLYLAGDSDGRGGSSRVVKIRLGSTPPTR